MSNDKIKPPDWDVNFSYPFLFQIAWLINLGIYYLILYTS